MGKVKKIRPILQMENTECGAASLAMILEFYGKSVPLEELRYECGVSRNGVNAKNIVKAAMHHGLSPSAFKVDMSELDEIATPAIIHWNMDHFLVLCGFDKKGALLADPAYGMRTVSMEEFSSSFTGIVIEFEPNENFVKSEGKKKENFIENCVKLFKPSLIYLVLVELCAVIASAALLFINSIFIDKILIRGNHHNMETLLQVLICAGVISAAALIIGERIKIMTAKHLNATINLGFMRRIFMLPIEFFSQRNSGDLASRQNSNMKMGQNIVSVFAPIPLCAMQIVVYTVLIFYFDVKIAFVGIIIAAINIILILRSSSAQQKKLVSYGRDMGVLQGDVSRTIDIIETLKSTGSEDEAFMRLLSSGTKMLNTKIKIEKDTIGAAHLFSYVNDLSAALVLIVGVWEILLGDMSTGVLISLQALVCAMLSPMGNLVNAGFDLQIMNSQTERTNDVMRYRVNDMFLDRGEAQSGEITGNIALDNVSFSHNIIDPPFIKNFSIQIKRGDCIAITGKSGSGKSTIAKIIAGLFSEDGGRVVFDESIRKELNEEYFYSKVAVVSQNIRLFDGTVMENIKMWDDSISHEDAVAAAKAACIHDDIIQRRNGYRERVPECGKNFSGGQRQRIEIARALVKKPRILIMDEATSALDADTEEKIMNNIRKLGITTILVAHRLSTIRDCDNILVMSKGEIIESGRHDELMALEGVYCDLIRSVN